MMLKAPRIFCVVAKVGWVAGLLYIPFLFLAGMDLIPVVHWSIAWGHAGMLWLALFAVLPLTAPWVWLRDAVRSRYASGLIRANAYLIDLTLSYVGPVVILFAIPIGFRVTGVEPMGIYFKWNPDNLVSFLRVVGTGTVLTVAYSTWWFFLLGRGQTPGKYHLKVRVVDADTAALLTHGRMFVREFLLKFLLMGFHSGTQVFLALALLTGFKDFAPEFVNYINSWPAAPIFYFLMVMVFATPIVFIVDIVWPFYGKDGHQTLHDKIVRSQVVNVSPNSG